jgi:hypothetical protein
MFMCSASLANACALEYTAVKATSDRPILTWDDAQKNSLGKTIVTLVAPGSYSSASFAINTIDASKCGAIQITASDLTKQDSPQIKISSSSIKINYVKIWYQGGTAWKGIAPDKTRVLVPELLVNDPTLIKVDKAQKRNYLKITKNNHSIYVDVSKDDYLTGGSVKAMIPDLDVKDSSTLQPIDLDGPQQLWIKTTVNKNISAGDYRGSLSIKNGGAVILQIPLQVTVYPFQLPPPKLEYAIYYRSQLFKRGGTISSEYKDETQFRAELADMREHGIANPTIYQGTDDWSLVKRALELRHEAGFIDKKLYYVSLSAANAVNQDSESKLKSTINKLTSLALPYGYTEIFLYGIDEASREEQKKQLSSWRVTQGLGAKIFAAGKVGTYDNTDAVLDLLVLAYEPNISEIQKFHYAGKKVFTYAFPQSGPENPDIFRRDYGITLWKAGVDGAMPYAYMHSFGSSWNDFDSAKYRDHQFVYPTADGVIDTIAWEGLHEGIEDVRYLTALENYISQLKNNSCGSNEN